MLCLDVSIASIQIKVTIYIAASIAIWQLTHQTCSLQPFFLPSFPASAFRFCSRHSRAWCFHTLSVAQHFWCDVFLCRYLELFHLAFANIVYKALWYSLICSCSELFYGFIHAFDGCMTYISRQHLTQATTLQLLCIYNSHTSQSTGVICDKQAQHIFSEQLGCSKHDTIALLLSCSLSAYKFRSILNSLFAWARLN